MAEKTLEGEILKNILNYVEEGADTTSEPVEPSSLLGELQSTVFDYEHGKPTGTA